MTKPSTSEEDYFAREDIEKRYKLAKEQAARLATEEQEKLKQAHWMRCPKCGHEISTIRFRDVEIERCFNCGVTVLDAGELEKLAGADEQHGVLRSIVNVFRRSQD